MKNAKRSALERIKQLKRQKMRWFYENANDQEDYWHILKAEDKMEDQIAALQAELAAIREAKTAKEQEMVGENKTQIERFEEEIRKAIENYESIPE